MSKTLPTATRSPRRGPGGPRRWTAADKAAYLAAFATRGLGLKAFCAETGVPRATFTYWRRHARAGRATAAPRGLPRARPAFVRVHLAPPPAALPGLTLVLRGPAGLAAELTGLDASTVVTVLRALLEPTAAR